MGWIPHKEFRKRRGEAGAKFGGAIRGSGDTLREVLSNPAPKKVFEFCKIHFET